MTFDLYRNEGASSGALLNLVGVRPYDYSVETRESKRVLNRAVVFATELSKLDLESHCRTGELVDSFGRYLSRLLKVALSLNGLSVKEYQGVTGVRQLTEEFIVDDLLVVVRNPGRVGDFIEYDTVVRLLRHFRRVRKSHECTLDRFVYVVGASRAA